jgi:glycosyltransferase 2 family protein
MAQNLRRFLSTGAKAAITLVLFVLLARKMDLQATLQHLSQITLFTAILCLLIIFSATAIATLRWSVVLRTIGRSFDLGTLFRLNLIGQFFNQALPSAVGGDGIRVWLLYRRGASLSEAFNSVLIDRGAGFAILAIMGLYGLPVILERLFAISRIYTGLGIAVASIVLATAFYALTQSTMRIANSGIGRFVAQIIADLRFLSGKPGDFAQIALLSLGTQICALVLVWLIMHALDPSVSPLGVMVVTPVVLLLLVLPISIAGWGLREGLFVVGFGLLHVREDVALATSIIFGLLILLAGLVGGPFWIVEPTRSSGPIGNPPEPLDPLMVQPRLGEQGH